MRISTYQLFRSGVSAMQRAESDRNHTALQMATGRRILTPSDDPSGATQSVMLNGAINKTEQYQRNADLAQPKLEQEEAQIDAVETYLQRVRELVVAGSNGTYDAANRKTMADEIRQIRDDILGVANSQDANGEYLFGGIDSFDAPFKTNSAGVVTYVGAEGTGAVREVAITPTRNVRVGDTGRSVFMDIPEKTGHVVEGVISPTNTGNLTVEQSQVVDRDLFAANADDVFTIRFSDNAGSMEYEVVDSTGTTVNDEDGNPITGKPYTDGMSVEFAGRSLTLAGTPQAGDSVTSRPASKVSLFDTLDAIATALETPATDEESKDAFAEASSDALLNIDSSLGRMNEVRTSVGLRLSALDTQADLNDQRLENLESTLSDVRDLDYADAISRYKLQDTVLQAAQQTYVQTSKLSLFDFL